MLGTGLIGDFYTMTLHSQRSRDRVSVAYSRSEERGSAFSERWDIPAHTTSVEDAINHPDVDTVVVALPNFLHEEVISLAADAEKAVLCTKPLARSAEEAKRILDKVESAGVFAGYLEDLCYTPKTLKAVESGSIGDVTWVRSREAHPGPHSAWFWDKDKAGGGAIVDLGCHCIEIIRSFAGKNNRPAEVMAWADTLVHPIKAEDNAVGLIRFESGALGQFEVSWSFRGGMDLRDEVAGTEGTIWLNHFLRTGYEMYTSGGGGGYVAEKLESAQGWLFPVGDEVTELGYLDMFTDMFDSMEAGRQPRETFYDGYIVNAVMDGSVPVGRVQAVGAGRCGVAGRYDPAHREARRHPRRSFNSQRGDPSRRTPQTDAQRQRHRVDLRSRHRQLSFAVEVIPNRDWAERTADRFSSWIDERPTSRVCLPTGKTVEPFYELVADTAGLSGLTIFLLAEFGGLPPGDPGRCESMIKRHLLDRAPGSPAVHLPDVDVEDLDSEAERYDGVVTDGGLDLSLVGLGVNGHIGMNEPGTTSDSPTRVVRLAASTTEHAAEYGATTCPTWGITIGMSPLLQSRELWLMVTGSHKATILERMVNGPIDSTVPASYLREHPNCVVLADQSAAARL